jgi:uncharacterized protein YndB with AHSA1/START domain
MSYTFTLSDIIPASPEAIYDAWLDSRGHSAMTGGKATASAEVGGAFTAWDGYISGRNVQLIPGTRIVQSWRTTQFPPGHQDSTITVLLAAAPGGTRVSITHASVPDDHKGYEDGGWQDHYFTPMKAYFAKPAGAKPKAAKPEAATAKPARKKVAKAKAAKAKTATAKASKAKTAKNKTAKAKKAAPKELKARATTSKTVKAVKKTKAVKRKTATRKPAKRKPAKRVAAKRRPARAKKRK